MRHLFLVAPGFEPALEGALPGSERLAPGLVAARDASLPIEATDFVFARQVVPNAKEARGQSVAELAAGALEHLGPLLDQAPEPWTLDVLVPDDPDKPWLPASLGARAALVGQRFLEDLEKKKRRAARRRVEAAPEALRLQLLLADSGRLFASFARPVPLASGAFWPSPFNGGRAQVEEDRSAPSSAHRKLQEALAWLGASITKGQVCVDLGAAPGGWSHVAAMAGAQVVAVDRAALDPILAARPGVEHVRGDAFTYAPVKPPVDWLLSDIIAEAPKSAALIERWAEERWFRRAIFHLKFKGADQYALAGKTVARLIELGYPRARAKHLLHDKNEITLLVG